MNLRSKSTLNKFYVEPVNLVFFVNFLSCHVNSCFFLLRGMGIAKVIAK
jgi:hypothetical protein